MMKCFSSILVMGLLFCWQACAPEAAKVKTHGFERIVVMGQAPLELLLELGYKDNIVGIAYLDQPSALKDRDELPILTLGWPDKETVLALKPDLIFALESAFRVDKSGDVAFWEQRAVRTCVLDNYKLDKSLESYQTDIIKTGALFGMEAKTDSLLLAMNRVREKYSKQKSVNPQRVLHLSYTGELDKYYYYPATMGVVDEVIQDCGAEFIDLGPNYFIYPLETILQANPDKIVISWFRKQAAVDIIQVLGAQPYLQQLKAIQHKQVIEVDYTQAIRGSTNMEPLYQTLSNFLNND